MYLKKLSILSLSIIFSASCSHMGKIKRNPSDDASQYGYKSTIKIDTGESNFVRISREGAYISVFNCSDDSNCRKVGQSILIDDFKSTVRYIKNESLKPVYYAHLGVYGGMVGMLACVVAISKCHKIVKGLKTKNNDASLNLFLGSMLGGAGVGLAVGILSKDEAIDTRNSSLIEAISGDSPTIVEAKESTVEEILSSFSTILLLNNSLKK